MLRWISIESSMLASHMFQCALRTVWFSFMQKNLLTLYFGTTFSATFLLHIQHPLPLVHKGMLNEQETALKSLSPVGA